MSKQDESSVPSSKVLIADDNLQNLELLEAYMAEMPEVEALRATDGEQTLEVILCERPDLVLLDIMMPKMSGFEVCKKMKADPETAEIPVIMVTALNEPMDMERGLESGADDYLTKPIAKQDLIDRVRRLLKIKHVKGSMDRSLAYMDELEDELDDNGEAQEE